MPRPPSLQSGGSSNHVVKFSSGANLNFECKGKDVNLNRLELNPNKRKSKAYNIKTTNRNECAILVIQPSDKHTTTHIKYEYRRGDWGKIFIKPLVEFIIAYVLAKTKINDKRGISIVWTA